MIDRFLFKKIDNSPLLIFRIFFGLLIASEGFGAIITGWVRRTLIEPQFTFNFIGFEFLQPLPGYGMYVYFGIMGTLGLLVAIGYRYRWSMLAFALMWSGVYLMQKTSYNNHYYLLMLLSFMMVFLPAEKGVSIDAKRNPEIWSNSMPSWVKWMIILQLFIVYTYAALAKLYTDWLDDTFIKILFQNKSEYPIVGGLLQEPLFQKFISVSGIFFDLLVVPAMLWKPTRKFWFICSIFFHLFNSVILHIGIFPYLALAFNVFFFEPETIRRIFFKKRPPYTAGEVEVPPYRKWLLSTAGIYFIIQLALPIRHNFFPDNVLWTEEGHRLSWRMMLRSRRSKVVFTVVDKETKKSERIKLKDYLSEKQRRKVGSYPDFIWQFAQHLKSEYAENGIDIEVYVNSKVSINGRPMRQLVDPKVDLAAEPWDHFRHHYWILPSNFDEKGSE